MIMKKKELAVGCLRKRQKVRQFPAAFVTKMHGIEAKNEGGKR